MEVCPYRSIVGVERVTGELRQLVEYFERAKKRIAQNRK